MSEKSKEEYLITTTNATQRNMTESDKYNQYNTLVKIYTEARDNGYALGEKMRRRIADDMSVSPAQVGKLDYIRNNATNELKERLSNNDITIAEAAEIAHHDKEKQATLKPKKDRIIDTLTQEEYFLPKDFFKENLKELTAVIEKCENSNNKTYDKKKYAKLLEAKNRVEQEIKRAEKLINP